jgi:hypothetical protein
MSELQARRHGGFWAAKNRMLLSTLPSQPHSHFLEPRFWPLTTIRPARRLIRVTCDANVLANFLVFGDDHWIRIRLSPVENPGTLQAQSHVAPGGRVILHEGNRASLLLRRIDLRLL